MDLDELLCRYDVDRAHARHVADLALELFDRTQPLHQLPPRARRLLEAGALLHNVGLHINKPLHHIVGRDIVLDEPLAGFSEADRAVLACLVMFHRKKVRPDLEPAFLRLGRRNRDMVLRLAALLRIADGLDYSETQSTRISDLEVHPEVAATTVHLEGPYAQDDAPRALKKADLWREVLRGDVELLALEGNGPPPHPMAAVPTLAAEPLATEHALARPDTGSSRVQFFATDPLAEIGRRLLRTYYQVLLCEEAGVCSEDSVEPVHKMRVATRRLRALLQIIRSVAPEREVRYFRRELQQLARALAPVRDTDVFLAAVQQYAATQPEPPDLSMLIGALHQQRATAYEHALAYFQSRRYANFKRDFAAFMTDQRVGWDTTTRVRDMAGSIIWRHYEALRAYEQHIDLADDLVAQSEMLHNARIAGKRLRYVIEVFGDVLGASAERALKPLVAMQEYLGELQDIAVATSYVATLEQQHGTHPAVRAYSDSRAQARAQLLAELPHRWSRLLGEPYRRDIARLLVVL